MFTDFLKEDGVFISGVKNFDSKDLPDDTV